MKRQFSISFFFSPAVLFFGMAYSAVAQDTSVSPSQQVLNLLAAPAPPNSPSYGLPSSFAGWSAEQQRTVPRQVEGRCMTLWTMMNSGGAVKILPSAQGSEDNVKLALDACAASKMPADWPARAAMTSELVRILARSKSLGVELVLPPALMH